MRITVKSMKYNVFFRYLSVLLSSKSRTNAIINIKNKNVKIIKVL